MLERISIAFREMRFDSGPHYGAIRLERNITINNTIEAIGVDDPEVLEDYPDDSRGPCCLIRGVYGQVVLHVVCTTADRPFLITAYHPDPDQWYPSYRRRKPTSG